MERELRATGILQAGHGLVDRIPEYDPRSGEHLWIAIMTYRVSNPEADQLHFDREALIAGPHIGCYHCERAYEKRELHRRCPGEPKVNKTT